MENKPESVPYFAYEGEITRQERHIRRLWIALIVAIVLVFLSNGAWLLYESLYDTISYSQDGAGLNNINTGEQGDVYGAEDENQKTKK